MRKLSFRKSIYFIIGVFFLLISTGFLNPDPDRDINLQSVTQEKAEDPTAYRNIISYKDLFLAVGTNGRIDLINKLGKVSRNLISPCNDDLNSVIGDDMIIIAVGDKGTILVSSDGQSFVKAESGVSTNIYSVSWLNGIFIAGSEKGTLLISGNGMTWSQIRLKLRGNITSLSSTSESCSGVTDEGEIIRSGDGLNWTVTDYNSEYSGYSKQCIFNKILLIQNRYVIAGKHTDGTPVVLFSTLGSVWTERHLFYDDDKGIPQMLTGIPNDIAYDAYGDQFFIACSNGEILSLPSCSKCNEYLKISENDLYGIVCTAESLVTVGEGYTFNKIDIR